MNDCLTTRFQFFITEIQRKKMSFHSEDFFIDFLFHRVNANHNFYDVFAIVVGPPFYNHVTVIFVKSFGLVFVQKHNITFLPAARLVNMCCWSRGRGLLAFWGRGLLAFWKLQFMLNLQKTFEPQIFEKIYILENFQIFSKLSKF